MELLRFLKGKWSRIGKLQKLICCFPTLLKTDDTATVPCLYWRRDLRRWRSCLVLRRGFPCGVWYAAGFGKASDWYESAGTEVVWQTLYQKCFWDRNGGPIVFGGISAFDIALWDIKGKAYGAPVYELLGGKHRDSLRAYASRWKMAGQVTAIRPGNLMIMPKRQKLLLIRDLMRLKWTFLLLRKMKDATPLQSKPHFSTHSTWRRQRRESQQPVRPWSRCRYYFGKPLLYRCTVCGSVR